MHVMIDLETWGVAPDAAIAQIGAVAFEPRGGGKVHNGTAFSAYVSLESNQAAGMSVDEGTLVWWLNQPDEARRRLASGVQQKGLDLPIALNNLQDWGDLAARGWSNFEGVWAHGSTFDLAILRTAFHRHGLKLPWRYALERDTRTVYMLMGGAPEVEQLGVSHDAVDDCVYQCCQLQKAFGILGLRP